MFALVKVYGLIVQDVVLFTKREDAEADFLLYTGVEYDKVYGDDGDYGNLPGDFDQTQIIEVAEPDSRLPYFYAGAGFNYPNYPENECICVKYAGVEYHVFFKEWQRKLDRPVGAVMSCINSSSVVELLLDDQLISEIAGRKFTPAAQ